MTPRLQRILFLAFLGCTTIALAADSASKFIGHWVLKPEQSELHPGSQWVTNEVEIHQTGRLLELTENQSFGADEDAIARQHTSLMLPDSTLSRGTVRTTTGWKNGALVETSFFMMDMRSGARKQRAVTRLEITDQKTLVRTTTVSELNRGWFIVLYEREVFERR